MPYSNGRRLFQLNPVIAAIKESWQQYGFDGRSGVCRVGDGSVFDNRRRLRLQEFAASAGTIPSGNLPGHSCNKTRAIRIIITDNLQML